MAATLGMVLYELATNAVKYGALSSPHGQVEVQWTVEQRENDGHLHLSWIESGGPAVPARTKEGFGTSFIVQSVAYELNGKSTLDMQSTGLRCTLDFPLPHSVKGASGPDGEGSRRA
jgi:two-component system CheB/CheR fusion protein